MSQEEWLSALKKENKTDKTDHLISKVGKDGFKKPVLSTHSEAYKVEFSRAPMSAYIHHWNDKSDGEIQALQQLGVGHIFLSEAASKVFQNHSSNGPTFTLSHDQGLGSFNSPLTARALVKRGANSVQEIIYLKEKFLKLSNKNSTVYIEVYLDSDLFHSIAKVRALKYLTKNKNCSVEIIGRVNPRYFSTLDEENNVLKNATAVMAGYISGVSAMESLPHLYLTNPNSPEAFHLSLSTQLILQAESNLQFVHDPASGSWTIDQLTEFYINQVKQTSFNQEKLEQEVDEYYIQLSDKVQTKKIIITGVNDFPNPTQVALKGESDFNRPADVFENLRFRFQQLNNQGNNKIKFVMVVLGDYASISARLNFAKNAVELLGVELLDNQTAFESQDQALNYIKNQNADAVLWVAQDEDYTSKMNLPLTGFHFVAGKIPVSGAVNIYLGQNLPQVFNNFLDNWSKI